LPGLTTEQLYEFLTTGRPIMKLGTIGPEGWPYVCPLWFDYDGETFTIAGRQAAKWEANIRANSKVSVCIDTYDSPYTRVIMEADAVMRTMPGCTRRPPGQYGTWAKKRACAISIAQRASPAA